MAHDSLLCLSTSRPTYTGQHKAHITRYTRLPTSFSMPMAHVCSGLCAKPPSMAFIPTSASAVHVLHSTSGARDSRVRHLRSDLRERMRACGWKRCVGGWARRPGSERRSTGGGRGGKAGVAASVLFSVSCVRCRLCGRGLLSLFIALSNVCCESKSDAVTTFAPQTRPLNKPCSRVYRRHVTQCHLSIITLRSSFIDSTHCPDHWRVCCNRSQ